VKWLKENAWKLFAVLVVALLVSILSANVAVGGSGGGGGCVSVVFDKASVMRADRIVIRKDGKEMTVTDPETVSRIASEFVVANKTALCDHTDMQLEIYSGDKIVRHVYWNDSDSLATIYDADAAHWVIPFEGKTGQVELSRELMELVERIIAEYGE
jgi:hypothetical protein